MLRWGDRVSERRQTTIIKNWDLIVRIYPVLISGDREESGVRAQVLLAPLKQYVLMRGQVSESAEGGGE